ncbi:PREDICTED: putative odorant receptor 85d isoform X1 [Vollenhovia emeryi]|uniref:putative odorant receptor 85d isoform X1 n=1 Tax=Vollenhovia emeryi TaxID=411798 RepID=UPI0005F4CF44|nr:PREDICTED: putative odorant receptor 85d isoform X1 [Vollenhovia emeryi]
MQLLSLNFLFYTIGGVWRPIKWSSKCSTHLYSMLTFFTMYLLNFSVLTQLLDIIFIVDNMDDFATNLLMLLSAITAFCKAATAITRRSEIISLIKILQEKPCKACDEEEINIQMKYDRLIRSCTISYTVLASFSTTGAITGQVLSTFHSELPHRIWVPYHYTPPSLFWLTSLHEMLALIVGTFVNVATETLLLGLCLQICAQLEILTHRLQREIKSNKGQQVCKNLNDTPNGTSRLSEHIYYHLCIIRFAEMANEIFSQVLFVQFFASILILCASVYYLSSPITVADFVTLIIFTFCMFVQIFIYCWAGNEVMLKSTGLGEAVFEMDWILMTISERKDLLMIMKRSTKPIKFTSTFLILKTSYSAFNVLHRS